MKPQNVSCPNTFAEVQNLCMLIALSSVSWLCAKNLCVNTGPIDVGKYSYKMPSKPQQQRVCFREIEEIEPIYMGGLNQVLQLKDIFISSAIVSLRRHWFASMVCCSSPDLFVEGGRIEEDIPLQQEQHSPILMEDFCLLSFCRLSQKHSPIAKIMWRTWLVPMFYINQHAKIHTGLFENKHYFLIILHELHKMQYFVTISKTFYILAFYRSNELKWCSAINCRNWLF